MIFYKHPHLPQELLLCPRQLIYAVHLFNQLSSALGINPVVTRVIETISGSSGVHSARRAVDFRDARPNGGFLYTESQRKWLLISMNEVLLPRIDKYSTLVNHSFKSGPLHWHLQVPNILGKYSEGSNINERIKQYFKIFKCKEKAVAGFSYQSVDGN